MSVILGEGTFRYEVAEGWGALPPGWRYGDVGAMGVDRKDNVYVFNRGPHPMIVFDRDGRFLRSWGEGVFHRAHGLHMGPDDTIYLTDDGDHTVRQCTLDGKILLTIGIPGRPAPFMSGEPFHRCTHTALSAKGELYVTDGRQRACTGSPDGSCSLVGTLESDPGQFNIVHNICADADSLACRGPGEPHRPGVRQQWCLRRGISLHRPCGLCMAHGKAQPTLYQRAWSHAGGEQGHPDLGPRISITDAKGRVRSVSDTCTPARRSVSSSPRTASPWTPVAISMWERSPTRSGRSSSHRRTHRESCAAFRSS
jgi:hypothetical protein